MEKNSRILITGHNGFVGKNLLNRLKKDGYTEIITFDRHMYDLRNQETVYKCFNFNPEYVFICAAKVGGIKANINNPFNFLYDNLMIQNNVIDACIKIKVRKALFLGSSCIYPKDYKQPLKEEYLLEGPLEPTNEGYALAKVTGLKLCEYANKQFNTNFISLMPCNLYGPGDNYDLETSHVLSALIRKIYNAKINNTPNIEIWGTGMPKRDFLYIDDLIDGMIWAMHHLKSKSFLNIGSGIDISIKELAEKIAKLIDYDGTFLFNTKMSDGMMKKCLDITKIKNLGWKPKTSLDEGIEKTIFDYIENVNK